MESGDESREQSGAVVGAGAAARREMVQTRMQVRVWYDIREVGVGGGDVGGGERYGSERSTSKTSRFGEWCGCVRELALRCVCATADVVVADVCAGVCTRRVRWCGVVHRREVLVYGDRKRKSLR